MDLFSLFVSSAIPLCLALLVTLFSNVTYCHTCIHDQLNDQMCPTQHQVYSSSSSVGHKRHSSKDYQPLRLTPYYGHINRSEMSATSFITLTERLIPAAFEWLSLALKVRPVSGNLSLARLCQGGNPSRCGVYTTAKCGPQTIPNEHYGASAVCSLQDSKVWNSHKCTHDYSAAPLSRLIVRLSYPEVQV
jgi:hypothetical protein